MHEALALEPRADPRLDQQVALIRSIAQHLDVADMRDARDLGGRILQQPLFGLGLTDNTGEGRQGALIAKGFFRIDQKDHLVRTRPHAGNEFKSMPVNVRG